jgi:hypothetical protein
VLVYLGFRLYLHDNEQSAVCSRCKESLPASAFTATQLRRAATDAQGGGKCRLVLSIVSNNYHFSCKQTSAS